MDIVKAFGKNVKKIRIQRNLSQTDLAGMVQVDYRTIQRIEKANRTTSILIAYRISRALNVDLESLFK